MKALMIRKLDFLVLAPVAVLFTMALPCVALAQESTSGRRTDSGADAPVRDTNSQTENSSEAGGKIFIDSPFDVTAREKPSTFFLFQRSTMDYDWARLDAQFSPLILESVQDPIF